MFRSLVLLVGGLASFAAASSFAQDAVVLAQKHGLGVHDYFAGDYTRAYEQLTAAIEGGSKDPRTFYFRGLCCLKLNREKDAVLNFKAGASLESRDVNKFYNVSKALERVQGQARVELERYRVEARMTVYNENERMRKARYEAILREESRVVRELPPGEPEEQSQAQAQKPAAEESAAPDPFAAPDEKPADKKKSSKKAEKKADDADPFAATEKKPEQKEEKKPAASDDPFAAPADGNAEKPKEKKAEKKADSDDPFAQ